MLDHMVGFGDLAESLAVVTGLSARRPARTLAQAADPRRLLQTIARRRLGTVRAVQPKPTLQPGDPRLQSRGLRQKRFIQRNKLFPRGLDRRFASYPILESEPESPVENTLPQPKIGSRPRDLGSYPRQSQRGANQATKCDRPDTRSHLTLGRLSKRSRMSQIRAAVHSYSTLFPPYQDRSGTRASGSIPAGDLSPTIEGKLTPPRPQPSAWPLARSGGRWRRRGRRGSSYRSASPRRHGR